MNILVTGAFKEYEKLKNCFLNHSFTFIQNEQEKLKIDVSTFEYAICNSLFMYNDILKFKSLRYIQVTSAGLDRLPLDYIDNNNIKVFNARGVYSIPMAEWTLCKLLDVYKKSFVVYENQKNHTWEKQRNINELNGKTATIVGFGNVGQEIAKRLYAFGVNIIAIDKYDIKNAIVKKSYLIGELYEGIKKSEIIIITLPLTNETKEIFNKDIFELINNNPILVNIARGQILNQNDLIEYHEKFKAIILDVFENEPIEKENEIWNLNNVIITPHNSFISENNDIRLFKLVKQNLEGVSDE